ncbi:PREDICTED: uncharacterized protein LOC109174777 [Ipomoea nil]|uniref:uncharacterized protein LOC109174777 n=1 Tax=Ipomoea nil TaxID=35883 RepID=UPI000901951F|nr:PREDICTED: uncharacterized protein LOC109174777 [Ipomoea nil]
MQWDSTVNENVDYILGTKRLCDSVGGDECVVALPGRSDGKITRISVVEATPRAEGTTETTHVPKLSPLEEVKFPSFNTRCTPKDLIRAMSEFNVQQRQAVSDMGMGGILCLEVNEIPLRLGCWLVSVFNPNKLTLNVQREIALPITREDVSAVLGLPLGSTEVVCRPSQKVGPELREWRAKIGKRDSTITLKKLEEVDKIRDLDWCGYLLKRLVKTHHDWAEDKMQRFTGPLLFLLLFYIDRVALGPRVIPRSVPALIGWTGKLLKERESAEIRAGGFGIGCVLEPLRDVIEIEEHEALGGSTKQGFSELLKAKSKLIVSTVEELIAMAKEAPDGTFENPHFKEALDATEKLFGMRRSQQPLTIQTGTQDDEAFWVETIAVADEIEVGYKTTEEGFEPPSFSLGLTQEFGGPQLGVLIQNPPECTGGENAGSLDISSSGGELGGVVSDARGDNKIKVSVLDFQNSFCLWC